MNYLLSQQFLTIFLLRKLPNDSHAGFFDLNHPLSVQIFKKLPFCPRNFIEGKKIIEIEGMWVSAIQKTFHHKSFQIKLMFCLVMNRAMKGCTSSHINTRLHRNLFKHYGLH